MPEKPHSVHSLPIHPHLKVQMVTGRGSGCSHIADHLALHHLLPHRDADGGAVRIERFLPISARLIANKAGYKFKYEEISALTADMAVAAGEAD